MAPMPLVVWPRRSPSKNDEQANKAALEKVRIDKLREVTDGHDGTWVAHPGLVSIAKEIFDLHMKTPNQLHITKKDFHCSKEDLLAVPGGNDHRKRFTPQYQCRHSLSRKLVKRKWRRRYL